MDAPAPQWNVNLPVTALRSQGSPSPKPQ